MNLNSKYLFKKLLKWAHKKHDNFNIYNVAFFLKKIKKHNFIILHLCTTDLHPPPAPHDIYEQPRKYPS